MADMLDLRGLPRDVNDEASLGGLKVVDDVLSELLEIAEGGGVAESLESIVGNDLDDLGHEGTRFGQQARVLENGIDDLLGGINGHSLGLGGAVLDEDLGDLELDLVTLLGIFLEAVEIDVDRQLRDVDARLGGSSGSRGGGRGRSGSVRRHSHEGGTSCEGSCCSSGDEAVLDHGVSSLVHESAPDEVLAPALSGGHHIK